MSVVQVVDLLGVFVFAPSGASLGLRMLGAWRDWHFPVARA